MNFFWYSRSMLHIPYSVRSHVALASSRVSNAFVGYFTHFRRLVHTKSPHRDGFLWNEHVPHL